MPEIDLNAVLPFPVTFTIWVKSGEFNHFDEESARAADSISSLRARFSAKCPSFEGEGAIGGRDHRAAFRIARFAPGCFRDARAHAGCTMDSLGAQIESLVTTDCNQTATSIRNAKKKARVTGLLMVAGTGFEGVPRRVLRVANGRKRS
jgi:hypothetical protein